MNAKLSSVLAIKLRPISTGSEYQELRNDGYNTCVREISQYEIDVEKLANVIIDIKKHELCDLNSGCLYIAKNLASNAKSWIVKRANGETK